MSALLLPRAPCVPRRPLRRAVLRARPPPRPRTGPARALRFEPRAALERPPRPLSAAGRTAAATGAYISAAGACLLAAPLRTLGLLFTTCSGESAISAPWVRVLGVLCLTFGSYYVGSAALESRGADPPVAFYRSTVFGRLALAAAFAALVATGLFPQRALLLVRACPHRPRGGAR